MTPLHATAALVALQRLAELVLANRNTRWLKKQGGIERSARHYSLFVFLHGSWWLAVLLLTPSNRQPNSTLLILFAGLQLGRLWVIASLGRYWTTRIIVLPKHPLIRRGPYRYLSHPNYMIVTAEIALLPLAFGDVAIAIFWSIANVVLLGLRIHIENAALASCGNAGFIPSAAPRG